MANGNGTSINKITVGATIVAAGLIGLAAWFFLDLRGDYLALKQDYYDYKLMVSENYVRNDEYHRDLAEIKVILRDIQRELKEQRQ